MEITHPLIEQSVLANGCRIITIEAPWVPRADIRARIPAGAGHDPYDSQGVAHALEHVVFKGPPGFKSEELTNNIESTGGYLNAHTDSEDTSFEIAVPARALDTGLRSLGDLVLRAAVPEEEWIKEREVIIEEIGMRFDDPWTRLMDASIQEFWGEHPLGQKIIGQRDSLEKMTVSDLREFQARHYLPSQIIVTVASPFTHAEIKDRVEQEGFGAEKTLETTKRLGRAEGIKGPSQTHIEQNSQQLQALFLRHGPSGLDWPDRMALMPVQAYLTRGQSARLFVEARDRLGLAYDVSGFDSLYRANGLIGAYAATSAAKLPAFEEVVRREFRAVAENGLAKSVLCDMKKRMVGEFAMNAHLMDWHMDMLIDHIEYGGPATFAEQVAFIEQLTSEQVAEAAAKWYNPDNFSRWTLGTGLDQKKASRKTRIKKVGQAA